jgi:hypothetical protein
LADGFYPLAAIVTVFSGNMIRCRAPDGDPAGNRQVVGLFEE